MKAFIHEDFLLITATARRLYHEFAKGLPIIDYHSHLNPAELVANRAFENLTELWLDPDQYKHRAMRSLGVPEYFILDGASAWEKFDRWASSAPLTIGSPLFHWGALELKNYFGITEPLNAASAARIWETCNAQLRQPSHTPRQLLKRSNVEYVCTSDLLLDDVSHHQALSASDCAPRIAPSLRADNALGVEAPGFVKWVKQLGAATGIDIDGLEAFQRALQLRLDVFASSGCTVSDHGIDVFNYQSISEDKAAELFEARYCGQTLNDEDALRLRSHLLLFLGREYARRNWVMLLHLGAQRHTSSRLRNVAGAKGGYAALGNPTDIPSLCQFLDSLDREEQLPRTILFSLNPTDNEALATLTGSYAQEGVAGKIQFGAAWWFNDHDTGIRAHLDALSRHGLLINFIGMTTDSRSLLSMSRHEYFRRVLCEWLGRQVEDGILPADEALLAELVRRVCYENARNWFSNSNSKTV